MNKVIVTRLFAGICWMQVCVSRDATDEEILDVCNKENPSGTTHGWGRIIRENTELNSLESENMRPKPCADDNERIHLLVSC